MKNVYQENNETYFQILMDIVKKYPRCYVNQLKSKKYQHILNWINSSLPLLHDSIYTISTKVYWILNNITDFPICSVCGKSDNYIGKNVAFTHGYFSVCSKWCASHNPIRTEKTKLTNLKKYGVENVFQDVKVKEKSIDSRLKNLGVAYPRQSKQIIEKTKQTCLEKYGDENFNNREKARKTCLEKYNVENPQQDLDIHAKTIKTNLEKYGVEFGLSNADVIDKRKKTCLEKYGSTSYLGSNDNINNNKLKSYLSLFDNENDFPLFSFDEYAARLDDHEIFKFKCKKCGNEFFARHHDGYHSKCDKCFPGLQCGKSNAERELFDFIKSIYAGKIYSGSRSIIYPLELDIYVPDKKLAFEFDGLYWHSQKDLSSFNKKYHLEKTLKCEEKGIQLIHIFENEWILKNDIVKSRIKNLFGVYDKIIFARKCEIREINNVLANGFLIENHIQGAIKSSINVGLFYNNELISLMTFGKCRFDKKHEWEMLRFCNKLGYHIPGAAGKLLKYFEKKCSPKSIVSYADRRWSQGKLYRALNFKLDHNSNPNYWYFKNNSLILQSRVKYQKHNLKNILDIFDESKTEFENMIMNNFFRIFDCGNIVFVKQYG